MVLIEDKRPDVTRRLSSIVEELETIVEQVGSHAHLDAREAARARDALYRGYETVVAKLRDAESTVSPSRWFG